MERYIKTDILAKLVFDKWQECDELKRIIPSIKRAIMCESTIDVVEVVRCNGCKYSIEDKLFGGLWCQHPTEKHCERNADFYCGSGKRKEDDS